MAKIGTAHIEIKPVINEEALEALVLRIEEAVAAGVARGVSGTSLPPTVFNYSINTEAPTIKAADADAVAKRPRPRHPLGRTLTRNVSVRQ